MIVTIHQPNFLPWFPFFEKMASADRFVLLTNCQFEKNGYQNRFFRDGNWYTMSTFKGLKPIREKKYVNCERSWIKIKKGLPKFKKYLNDMDQYITPSLSGTNCGIITHLAKIINPNVEIVYDWPTHLLGTERLVDICKYYGATTYIAGPSGKKYMDMSLWKNAGINVEFHENKNKTHTLDYLETL